MSYKKKSVLWIFILLHIIKIKELLFIQKWAFSNPGFFLIAGMRINRFGIDLKFCHVCHNENSDT